MPRSAERMSIVQPSEIAAAPKRRRRRGTAKVNLCLISVPMLWLRQPDAIGALGLAVNTSRERDGNADEAARIEELLVTAHQIWREAPQIEDDAERTTTMRAAIQLVNLMNVGLADDLGDQPLGRLLRDDVNLLVH